jgi:predicted DNA-binding protein (UPF0251 family)
MSDSGQMAVVGDWKEQRAEMAVVQREPAGAMQVPRRRLLRRLSGSLSEDQKRALGLVTQGVSIKEAGQQLGIHRGTIYRWLQTDPYFRAAYNAWQLEQKESCRAALVQAAEVGVKRVIEAMQIDQKLAWQVIKELGILTQHQPLTVDPSRVEMEIALEDHEEESVLLRRIESEVDNEPDVMSPRGSLARLLRLQSEAEQKALQESRRPEGQKRETEEEHVEGGVAT